MCRQGAKEVGTFTCNSVPMRFGKSLLQRSAMRTPTSKPGEEGRKGGGGGGGGGTKKKMEETEARRERVTDFFEDTLVGPRFARSSAACGGAALELNEGGEQQLKARA